MGKNGLKKKTWKINSVFLKLGVIKKVTLWTESDLNWYILVFLQVFDETWDRECENGAVPIQY